MTDKQQIEEMAKIIDDNHGFVVSSVETAKALYNAGYRKQSGWISVEERLPNGQGHCLIVNKEGYVMTALWTKQFGWFSHIDRRCKVTHWMPLPEQPKMKGYNK